MKYVFVWIGCFCRNCCVWIYYDWGNGVGCWIGIMISWLIEIDDWWLMLRKFGCFEDMDWWVWERKGLMFFVLKLVFFDEFLVELVKFGLLDDYVKGFEDGVVVVCVIVEK